MIYLYLCIAAKDEFELIYIDEELFKYQRSIYGVSFSPLQVTIALS